MDTTKYTMLLWPHINTDERQLQNSVEVPGLLWTHKQGLTKENLQEFYQR